jgi:shikimate dehydrogenase
MAVPASISGATRLAAVIGDPARHSLSPALHNAAFAACSLDWVYLAFDVARGSARDALAAMRVLGIDGYSVTMPHKSDVAAAVDECSDDAAALGAVNCVVNVDGTLIGHNTDGEGFLRGLRHDAGRGVEGRRCAVLGAGGAARAVVRALATDGAAEIVVVNRSAENGAAAAALGGAVARVGAAADVAAVDVVVNATPVGMNGPQAGQSPVPAEVLHEGQVVVDLVYDPLDTPLLAAARARGAGAHNGVSMLVFQAARAFELWTGTPAPVEAMLAAAAAALAARAKY